METVKPDCSKCEFFCSGHFGTSDEGLINLLEQEGMVNRYEPGQVIFHEGTPSFAMYCLRSGLVKTYRRTRGSEQLIKVLGSGEAFGYADILSGEPYFVTAEAITPSEVCTIPRRVLLDMIERSLPVAFELLSRLSREMRTYQDQLTLLTQGSVKNRIAGILLSLADTCGEETGGKIKIKLPIQQKQMAQMAGIAPESLSRTLRSLAADGILGLSQKQITVKDKEALGKILQE